ncbi:hypothetical protein L7F22_028980 [Adiantum nelumboides]|nr:hypothetical protein [Adiantum nelumboides]
MYINQTFIAFLSSDIFEEVYVMQGCGFVKKGQEDKVCKCSKALYGLKQSPRAWYEKDDPHLVKRGFYNSSTESTLYVKREGDVLLIVILYVDDLLITGSNKRHNAEFKADLNATFKMKELGLLHHYWGIQLEQCDCGIAYIESLLCKFGLEDFKPIATPMKKGLNLVFMMLVMLHMSLFTKLLLDASFMYATQGEIFTLQPHRSADLCIA